MEQIIQRHDFPSPVKLSPTSVAINPFLHATFLSIGTWHIQRLCAQLERAASFVLQAQLEMLLQRFRVWLMLANGCPVPAQIASFLNDFFFFLFFFLFLNLHLLSPIPRFCGGQSHQDFKMQGHLLRLKLFYSTEEESVSLQIFHVFPSVLCQK